MSATPGIGPPVISSCLSDKYVMVGWGANTFGQLATGNVMDEPLPVPIPLSTSDPPAPILPPQRITGGANHTLLVDAHSRLFVSGSNQDGQLGIPKTDPALKSMTISPKLSVACALNWTHVPCSPTIEDMASGWAHSLICLDSGQVLGFGDNTYGQVTGTPTQCTGMCTLPLPLAVSVACGLRHSLALTRSGMLYAWGASRSGQCGIQSPTTNGFVQIALPMIEIPKSIATGAYHSLVSSNSGRVYGFGLNKHGQLGRAPHVIKSDHEPKLLDMPENSAPVGSVAAGWTHSIALTESGHVATFGRNNFGQLGRPADLHWIPAYVDLTHPVTRVVAGSEHTSVITSNGRSMSWGWNEHGNCGVHCASLENWHTVSRSNRPSVDSLHLDNVLTPTDVAWNVPIRDGFEWRVVMGGGGYAHTFVVLEPVDRSSH